MDIDEAIRSLDIEYRLKKLVYYEDPLFHSVEWGVNYIFFSPCKRIRPLLLLETNKAFAKPNDNSYILAALVEMIHTYSLVHDDLPCMDDDKMRRGQPTLHTIVDEAYALLVGDGLLTGAFGLLSKYTDTHKLPQIIKTINDKSGTAGMIRGQFLDLKGERSKLELDSIKEINYYKTCCMIELAMMLGAINGGADNTVIENIEKIGTAVGHIFQLQDDILDITGNSAVTGKSTGQDSRNNKSSMPLSVGIDETRKMMENYAASALELSKSCFVDPAFFYGLIEFLMNRVK